MAPASAFASRTRLRSIPRPARMPPTPALAGPVWWWAIRARGTVPVDP